MLTMMMLLSWTSLAIWGVQRSLTRPCLLGSREFRPFTNRLRTDYIHLARQPDRRRACMKSIHECLGLAICIRSGCLFCARSTQSAVRDDATWNYVRCASISFRSSRNA